MRAPAWIQAAGLAVLAAGARADDLGAGAASLSSTYRSIGLGLTAAITMVGSVFGAAWAVGRIGSAVMGAAAEKPEILTRSLIFVALAEGLAVLGFAISVMLLQKL